MPNNDMGTANARIRLTYEEKGSAKANASVEKMQQQMKLLESKLEVVEKALADTNKRFEENQKAVDKASGANERYQGATQKASQSSKGLDRDVRNLNSSFLKMQATMALLENRMAKAERTFMRNTKAIRDTNTALKENADVTDRASRASRGYSAEIFRGHKKIRAFRNDVRYLTDDLKDLANAYQYVSNKVSTASNFFKFLDTMGSVGRSGRGGIAGKIDRNMFRSLAVAMADLGKHSNASLRLMTTGINENSRQWIGVFKNLDGKLMGTRATLGLTAAAFFGIRRRIMGTRDVISQSGGLIQSFDKFNKVVGLSSRTMGFFGRTLKPMADVEKFTKSLTFNTAIKGLQGMSGHVEKFGRLSQKTFGFDITGGLSKHLREADKEGERFFNHFGSRIGKLQYMFAHGNFKFDEFSKGSKPFVQGLAQMTVGLKNLWQRFQWFFKLPKPLMAAMGIGFSTVLPEALNVFGKSLQMASTLISGFWSGIKQLSGGVLILPGALATVGAAVSSLGVVFAGLKDKFKDIFSEDPDKSLEALWALPEHLRPLGAVLREVSGRFREMQKNLQITAFRHVEDQIKSLSDMYFPLFERGADRVVQAFVNLKNNAVKFALEPQTGRDFAKIYENTATAIYAVSNAIKPALAGFRDLAAVGSEWGQSQASWLNILTTRFQNWVAVNRQNGRLMIWMNNAKDGALDLATGLKDATVAAYKIITIFSTSTGTNFLEQFATQMKKFEDAVGKSSLIGFLQHVRSNMRDLASNNGAEKFADFKTLMNSFGDALHRILPFLTTMSNAFSDVFITMMENSIKTVSKFVQLLNQLGASQVIGWILGVAGAVTLLPKVLATAIDGFRILAGAWAVLRSKAIVFNLITNAVMILGNTMQNMPGIIGRWGTGLQNAANSGGRLLSLASAAASAVLGVGTAALIMGTTIHEGDKQVQTFGNTLKRLDEDSAKFKVALHDAFIDDGSLAGSNVLDAMNHRVTDFMSNLETLQNQTPSIAAHVGDFLSDMFVKPFQLQYATKGKENNPFADSDTINKYQMLGDNAKRARAELGALVQEGTNLSSVIRMSNDDFNAWIANQEKLGKITNETAAILRKEHDSFTVAAEAAKQLGPAGAAAAEGFDKLAQSVANSSSRLDAFRQVMVALGFIQIDAAEAAANYGNAISNLSDKVAEAIENGDGLNNVFDQQGRLNALHSKTAANLVPVFKDLSNAFLALSFNGGNVNEMMDMIDGQIAGLAQQLQTTPELLRQFLATTAGIVSEPVQIGVQLQGKNDVQTAFADMYLEMLAMAQKGIPIAFTIKGKSSQEMATIEQGLESIVGDIFNLQNGTNLVLKPEIGTPSPEQLAALRNWLVTQGGFTLPGMATPPPGQVPQIKPNIVPPAMPGQAPGAPGQIPQIPGMPVPPAALPGAMPPGQLPPMFTPQQDQQSLDEVSRQIDDLKQKFEAINAKELKLKVTIEGKQDFDSLYDRMNQIVTVMVSQWAQMSNAVSQALQQLLPTIDADMAAILGRIVIQGQNFYNAGFILVNEFARGISGNPAMIQAVDRMVKEALRHVHQSPPKKGPLAAHGDAILYAGNVFSQQYAAGITSSSPQATAAVRGMGGIALQQLTRGGAYGNGMGGGSGIYKAGQALGGQLSQIVQALQHGVQAFQWLGTSAMQLMKIFSDPMGKGTVFGQRPGWKRDPNVSSAEAQRRKEDAYQQAYSGAAGSATRAGLNDMDPLTGMPKITGPGLLARNASKGDIQAAMVAKGQAAGMTKEQIATMMAVAEIESHYDPGISGGSQPMAGQPATAADTVLGLFQEKGSFGTPEQRTDPNQAIDRFIQRFLPQVQQHPDQLLLAATLAQNPQLGANAPGSKYFNTVQGAIPDQLKAIDEILRAGTNVPMTGGRAIPGMGPGGRFGVPGTGGSKLKDTGKVPSIPAAQMLAAIISQQFPEIQEIGGSRDSGAAAGTHEVGRALDIMMPGGSQPESTTAADRELGDRINAWLHQNAEAFGLQYTIWQDIGRYTNGGAAGAGKKGEFTAPGHHNHIDVQFKDGARADIGPQGTKLKMPFGSGIPADAFGPPNVPGTPGYRPSPGQNQVQVGPGGGLVPVPVPQQGSQGAEITTEISGGNLIVKDKATGRILSTIDQNITQPQEIKDEQGRVLTRIMPRQKPGEFPFAAPPENVNQATGQPYTPQEAQDWMNQHPLILSGLTPDQQAAYDPNRYALQGPDDMLEAIRQGNSSLDQQILQGQQSGASQQQVLAALNALDSQITAYNNVDTPASRAQAQALEGIQNDIATQNGMVAQENPFDAGMSAVSGMSGIANDVLQTMQTAIDAVNSTKNIADTLLRNPASTEDLFKMVDDAQVYLELAANVAQTFGDVLSMAGSFTGGSDFGGVSAAGQAAQLISSAIQGVNAAIDMAQELYRIVGSYVGDFLSNLMGGPEGALQGDMKMLLDEQTGQLLAYSSDNPMDKRAHTLAGQTANPEARNQLAGQINVYGGPGVDPRDSTRQMMYQIKVAQMTQATSP